MKVALTSDNHLGLTPYKTLRNMYLEMRKHNPDVIVNAGDNNGNKCGYKKCRSVFRLMREIFPDTPILFVKGNHDYWNRSSFQQHVKVSQSNFEYNLERINASAKDFNIWQLDVDGVYRRADFEGIMFLGHPRFYKHRPFSNDFNFMPEFINGEDIFDHLKDIEQKEIDESLQKLTDKDKIRIFVSHIPVAYGAGQQRAHGTDRNMGDFLRHYYGVTYFLAGHVHNVESIPENGIYFSGSDYREPRFVIFEVK